MRWFLLPAVIVLSQTVIHAQPDWRISFEYNEIGLWSSPHHDSLLNKLEPVTGRSAINVNGLGSWTVMQKTAASPIDFRATDDVVTKFQSHGFELTWYLRSDATWAFPSKTIPIFTTAAPDPQFEDYWKRYVRAVVERYDGDGVDDMPGLRVPIRYYIQIGEVKFGISGKGDEEVGPFWADNIDNLLRLHRITYQAVREADPSGNTKIVSSGALMIDLYADFPDYPAFDPPDTNSTIGQRLQGKNNRGSRYVAGFDSLKKMLSSFGNDSDGIECDYIGWHPHFSWRVIDQEFAMIRALTGGKPIYVDDMWSNIFAVGYAAGINIPGLSIFNAPKFLPANTNWVKRVYGDFPNMLFTGPDPHAMLFSKLNSGDQGAIDWYYANGTRQLVKSFVSAFGEGAERAAFSGTNDLIRGINIGWLNLLGTRNEGYREKPQYYTLKLLVEKIRDFTRVDELNISADPRTRVYRFERPRGPLYVMWSETGDAPPNLDYRIVTGETVTIGVESDSLLRTFLVTARDKTTPETEWITTTGKQLTVRSGYEPMIIEPKTSTTSVVKENIPSVDFFVDEGYPNPFLNAITFNVHVPASSHIQAVVYDAPGRIVKNIFEGELSTGVHSLTWDGHDSLERIAPAGIYILSLQREGLSKQAQRIFRMIVRVR